MATKPTVKAEWDDAGYEPYDIDIVCVIGSVHVDPYAESGDTIVEAAFKQIANHDKDGQYSFTLRNGRTYNVTVQVEPGVDDYGKPETV